MKNTSYLQHSSRGIATSKETGSCGKTYSNVAAKSGGQLKVEALVAVLKKYFF